MSKRATKRLCLIIAAVCTLAFQNCGAFHATDAGNPSLNGLSSTISGPNAPTVPAVPTVPVVPTSGASGHLTFTTQPGGAGASVGWPQQPVVTAYDANGNVTSAAVAIKLTLNATGTSLRGYDPNAPMINGSVSYSNLSIGKPGTYTLTASAPGFGSTNSASFSINAPSGRTFYISPSGNDANTGLSTSTPWQSINKVNSSNFTAGDSILFEGGQTFSGCLAFNTNVTGTAAQPVTVGAYGSGPFRVNVTCTKSESNYYNLNNTVAVRIGGITGFVLQDCVLVGNAAAVLAATPTSPPTYGAAYGVLFDSGGYGSGLTTSSVTIQRCDISGFTAANWDFGGEIFFNPSGPTTHISLLDNTLHGTAGAQSADDNGVGGNGNASSGNVADMVIQGNHIFNIGSRAGVSNGCGGNGVVMAGTHVLIENNVAHDNGANINTCGGSANFWLVSANLGTIQYNESYRNAPATTTQGGCDWDGFDLDLSVTNSVIQYNYSHDNYGVGYLAYVANTWGGNTYRYNLSVSDGTAFDLADWSGASGNLDAYNNTFDVSGNSGLIFGSGGTAVTGYFANNILLTGANANFSNTNGGTPSIKFVNNAYWSPLADPTKSYFNWSPCSPCLGVQAWQNQTGQDPKAIVLNGSPSTMKISVPSNTVTCSIAQITSAVDGSGIAACLGGNYKPQSGSPFIASGSNLRASPYNLSPSLYDLSGDDLSSASQINVGAFQ